VINVMETLLSPRVRNILSLKERQVVGNTVNLVAQLMYELHRIVARPRAIRDFVDSLVIVVHCNGGLVIEVFCRKVKKVGQRLVYELPISLRWP